MTTNNTLAERGGWMPIETAPNHTHKERILVVGGAWPKPDLMLPDGDWWRMRIREGSTGQPTHWMPLPPAPNERGGTGEEGHQDEQGNKP